MIEPVNIQIRYSDMDLMGHVNNAVYLNYFEYTRVYYFEKLLGKDWDWEHEGFILVQNKVEYLTPLLLKDNPVIEMSIGNIGNKSFVLHYELRLKGEIYTRASSKMVGYDMIGKKSIVIPTKMKKSFSLLMKYQQES
jgi:acyl-CoA thioester hydrolase